MQPENDHSFLEKSPIPEILLLVLFMQKTYLCPFLMSWRPICSMRQNSETYGIKNQMIPRDFDTMSRQQYCF